MSLDAFCVVKPMCLKHRGSSCIVKTIHFRTMGTGLDAICILKTMLFRTVEPAEGRTSTGLHAICIIKTMFFRAVEAHGGSSRPKASMTLRACSIVSCYETIDFWVWRLSGTWGFIILKEGSPPRSLESLDWRQREAESS